MIDFTQCKKLNKTYSGANGNKISILYEGKTWMLKFPSKPTINKEMSYTNGCTSEYLGSHIFNSIGIPAQNTLLGNYTKNGKDYTVVACEDFTSPGLVLQDFASLKNTVIDTSRSGYGTELAEILDSINQQEMIDKDVLLERFWDMFIVDSLIGNWDRHNGNWGFLYNTYTNELVLAPVYDCGSSLYPQADEKVMDMVIEKESERNARVYNRPLSAVKDNGNKINYYDFISSLKNDDCNKALKRIHPKINISEITSIVQNADGISNKEKLFYTTMLKERKEKILDYSYEKLFSLEKDKKTHQSFVDQIIVGKQKSLESQQQAKTNLNLREHVPIKEDSLER